MIGYSQWKAIVIIGVLLVSLVDRVLFAQQLVPLTREEAAQILQRVVQVTGFPATLHWLTTNDLPARREVHVLDVDLQATLREQGLDDTPTLYPENPTWSGVSSPFEDCYWFLADYAYSSPEDTLPVVWVNMWTGKVYVARPDTLIGKTNSDLGLGNLTPWTEDQLRQRALNIMTALYGEGNYVIGHEEFDYPLEDYDGSFIIYKIDPETGARLLTRAAMTLNSRTGNLEGGVFYNRPVTISTKPTITKAQARQIALNFLKEMGVIFQEWLYGFVGFQIISGTNTVIADYVHEGLEVQEDGLLEQFLVWELPFKYISAYGEAGAGVLTVNAHTGEVMPSFSMAMEIWQRKWRSKKLHQGPVERDKIPIQVMFFNGHLTYLCAPLLLQNGRLFISRSYADNLGVTLEGNKLKGRVGETNIEKGGRFHYMGREYLSLRQICEVSGIRLWWDNESKVPVLRAEWLEAKKILAQRQR